MTLWKPYKITLPGKWVLTGEHSVLRGGQAIAFPFFEKTLSLEFQPHKKSKLEVFPEVARKIVTDLFESNLLPKSKEKGARIPIPCGELRIESSLPIGAGLGSSAAFCVGIGRWIQSHIGFQDSEVFKLATALENQFHGKSSGMDIAVILCQKPILYSIHSQPLPLDLRQFPKFTFHDTKLRTSTAHCIDLVENFIKKNPALASRLDKAMDGSTKLASQGLTLFNEGNPSEGTSMIQRAMHSAHECFLSWRLAPGKAVKEIRDLIDQGAMAAKLTGAGGGGMIVALWDSKPQEQSLAH